MYRRTRALWALFIFIDILNFVLPCNCSWQVQVVPYRLRILIRYRYWLSWIPPMRHSNDISSVMWNHVQHVRMSIPGWPASMKIVCSLFPVLAWYFVVEFVSAVPTRISWLIVRTRALRLVLTCYHRRTHPPYCLTLFAYIYVCMSLSGFSTAYLDSYDYWSVSVCDQYAITVW